MTPNTPKQPRSRVEILADPTLSAYQAGLEIDALIKGERGHRPAPETVALTSDERQKLAGLKIQLENLQRDFATVEKNTLRFEPALPEAENALVVAEQNTANDPRDESIQKLIVAERRVQFIRSYLANASQRKNRIHQEAVGIYGVIWKDFFLKFFPLEATPNFIPASGLPQSFDSALACIEGILKK